uniref:CST complex subunit STN1 n=1 Tax=Ananas comosus var. bracteatus TaxID=296719 RepID=A0A6V7Q5E8_ANACO|nr:unnamed protein product [Ananas comosus var. bracteatus]
MDHACLPLCSFTHACEGRSPQAGIPELAYAILCSPVQDWVLKWIIVGSAYYHGAIRRGGRARSRGRGGAGGGARAWRGQAGARVVAPRGAGAGRAGAERGALSGRAGSGRRGRAGSRRRRGPVRGPVLFPCGSHSSVSLFYFSFFFLFSFPNTRRSFSASTSAAPPLDVVLAAECVDAVRLGALVRVRGRVGVYRGAVQITVADVVVEKDPNSEVLHWLDCIRLARDYYDVV